MIPFFILPPHPSSKSKVKRETLDHFEKQNLWVAQRKFNGTHVVIWTDGTSVALWDRRGNPLTLYKLTEEMRECISSVVDKVTVFAGELLHTKAKSKITGEQAATDTIVLFDVLYYGEHLTNINQDQRLALLDRICSNPRCLEDGSFFGATKRALVVNQIGKSKLWLAEKFYDEFSYHYDECYDFTTKGIDKYPEIEGLILRLKNSYLRANHTGDVDWILRCRKLKDKVYDF